VYPFSVGELGVGMGTAAMTLMLEAAGAGTCHMHKIYSGGIRCAYKGVIDIARLASICTHCHDIVAAANQTILLSCPSPSHIQQIYVVKIGIFWL
jgi:hypothetical protein